MESTCSVMCATGTPRAVAALKILAPSMWIFNPSSVASFLTCWEINLSIKKMGSWSNICWILSGLIEKDHQGDRSPKNDVRICGRHLQGQVIDSLDRLDYCLSSDRLSLDSEDGFRTGCRNVSHKQQPFSGFWSPRWSFSIKVCYSWAQAIFS